MSSQRNINYLNKDFNSLRNQLIEYAKNYFPDTYSDFSATSPGMMYIEMAAYVGDIISLYQDLGIQETFLQYAKNPANLYAMAYMMGYRPKVTSVSSVDLTVQQIISASATDYTVPDWSKAYKIMEGSTVRGTTSGNPTFILRDTVDMKDSTDVEISALDDNLNPSEYTLTSKVKAYSGTIKTITKSFGSYKKYQTVEIVDDDIVGILEATDSNGNIWKEVPFLGQDTIFTESNISGSYILGLEKVPRRFVTRFNANGNLEIQFGAGMYADDVDEEEFLPSPVPLEADIQEQSSERYDLAYDPSNFLFSKSYGLAPTNTTITFKYVVGGGVQSNVAANTITKPGTLNITYTGGGAVPSVTGLSFNNKEAATGGRDGDTLEEIRQNALRAFAEQKRAVTLKDYNVRALAMPAKFGSVAKVYAMSTPMLNVENNVAHNSLSIDLYVLSYDSNGKLTPATNIVKSNLKTYMSEYTMLTDTVNIKDAYIINIGVKYDIVVRPGFNNSDVLLRCNEALQDYLATSKRNINEVLNLAEAYLILSQIKGVQLVKNIKVVNLSDTSSGYSKYTYDVEAALRNQILYPSYDPCIFEVRYPKTDIEGRIVTL